MTADAACTCTMTDPRTWTRYGSAVEPGSMLEPNPDCPEHFPKADAAGVSERERLIKAILSEKHGPTALAAVIAKGPLNPQNYYAGRAADAILAAGFGDVAQAKADALEDAATWAEGIADGMAVGSYVHGPSGREADLSMKYQHAAGWLSARAAEYRSTPSTNEPENEEDPLFDCGVCGFGDHDTDGHEATS